MLARLFAEAYLANWRKASDAARAIGVAGSPGSIAVKANRLLKQARESGLLEKRLRELTGDMGAAEVVLGLSRIARGEAEEQERLRRLGIVADLSQYVRQVEVKGDEALSGGSNGHEGAHFQRVEENAHGPWVALPSESILSTFSSI